MDNSEGQVTYPDKQDGRATYRLLYVSLHTLRFYLCFLYNQAYAAGLTQIIIGYAFLIGCLITVFHLSGATFLASDI